MEPYQSYSALFGVTRANLVNNAQAAPSSDDEDMKATVDSLLEHTHGEKHSAGSWNRNSHAAIDKPWLRPAHVGVVCARTDSRASTLVHTVEGNALGPDPQDILRCLLEPIPQERYRDTKGHYFVGPWSLQFPEPVHLLAALDETFVGGDSDMWKKAAFDPVPSQNLSFRIEWPGYPSWSRQQNVIHTVDRKPASKSVAKVAHEIAKAMQHFIEERSATRTTNAMWRVGQGAIELGSLYLLAIEHVAHGSLKPVLAVLPDLHSLG